MIKLPPLSPEVSLTVTSEPNCYSFNKNFRALLLGYKRIKPIKRTRKRQIAKARHMMAEHDHTSYEWSQWWPTPARKPKRWKR